MVIMIFLVLAFVSSSESPTKTTLSSQSQSSPSKPSIDLLFQEWVLKYNKTYSTSDNEMIKRKEIFKRNYLHIQRFNSQGNLKTVLLFCQINNKFYSLILLTFFEEFTYFINVFCNFFFLTKLIL